MVQKQSKKDPSKKLNSRELVLTLAENMTAEEVNTRLDKVVALEEDNKFNPSFNSLTDPRVIVNTKGVEQD